MNYERYQERGVLGIGCVDTVLQSFKCKIIVFLHSGNDVVYINTKFNQKLMTINKRKHLSNFHSLHFIDIYGAIKISILKMYALY